jgi:hypothetical protein
MIFPGMRESANAERKVESSWSDISADFDLYLLVEYNI